MGTSSRGVTNVTPPNGCFISNPFLLSRKETVPDRQFDWGGLLINCTLRFQRSTQAGWKSAVEYNGISRLYCETHKSSSHESGT